MLKKIFFLRLLSFIGLFSVSITLCFAGTSDSLNQTKDNILTLVTNGNYAQAEYATKKLSEDYAGNQGLAESLYWIAEQYKWSNEYNNANRIYQQIIDNHAGSPWASKARFGILRAEVLSLIMSQNFNGAQKGLDKLVVDFAENSDLPETIYQIADKYRWWDRFEDANYAYQQIVLKYPNSPWASKAQLNISKMEALSLIAGQNFSMAQAVVDKLRTDFAGHPDLPEALYWIGEKYEWAPRYEESKCFYQQVIQKNPSSFWASKARLSIARADVMAFITSEEYDKASNALNKLLTDFVADPNLPETVYWISEKYKWSNRADESSRICRLIMQKFPDSKWAGRAKLGISRGDLMALVATQDYNRPEEAIDKLAADFAGHPDLPGTLYYIAERYKWSSNPAEANYIYQRIIKNYPDSLWAGNARLGISTSDVLPVIMASDYDKAEKAVDKMVVDFAGNPKVLSEVLFLFGEKYYRDANSEDYLNKAIIAWNKIIEEMPSTSFTPMACYLTAVCHCRLGEYDKAAELFNRLIEQYPSYSYAAKAKLDLERINASILPDDEKKRAVLFFESQHQSWLAIKSGKAHCEITSRDLAGEGKPMTLAGTLEFVVTPVAEIKDCQGPAMVQVRLSCDVNNLNFVRDNVFDTNAAPQVWADDPNQLPSPKIVLILKELFKIGTEQLFLPLDFMAKTYPDEQNIWANKYSESKGQFFLADRGLPIRLSTQEETTSVFGGEPQYLFLASPALNDANYWFSANTGQLREIEILHPEEQLVCIFRYENYIQPAGQTVSLPRLSRLTRVYGNKDVHSREYTVQLTNIELNVAIPPKRFVVFKAAP